MSHCPELSPSQTGQRPVSSGQIVCGLIVLGLAWSWWNQPRTPKEMLARADVLLSERDGPGALSWIQEAADRGYPEAQRLLGDYHREGTLVQQDHGTAYALYKEAAEAGDAEAMFWFASYKEDGNGTGKDPRGAFKWFNAAAQLGHLDAQVRLARCFELGIGTKVDATQAVTWYSRASSRGLPDATYALGRCYTDGRVVPRDLVKARGLFRDAGRAGHQAAACSYAALLRYGLGGDRAPEIAEKVLAGFKAAGVKEATAEGIAQLALRFDPKCADAYLDLARSAYSQGNKSRAMALCGEAMQAQHDEVSVFQTLSAFYQDLGDLPAAVNSAARAVQLNPGSAQNRVAYGQVLRLAGKLVEAERELLGAVNLDSLSDSAWSNLAWVHADLDRPDDAYAECNRALKINPKSNEASGLLRYSIPKVYCNMAYREMQVGDFEACLKHADAAITLDPKTARPYIIKSHAYWRLGQWPWALGWGEKALEVDPKNPESHAVVGDALQKLGRTQEARERYSQALSLRPEMTWVRQQQAELDGSPGGNSGSPGMRDSESAPGRASAPGTIFVYRREFYVVRETLIVGTY